jgi:hypothetical protein
LSTPRRPDCIKGNQCPGYTSDGPNGGNTPPNDPSASQNIGYADHLMHKYWHFIDIPFAKKGMLAAPAPSPNAVTQILLFRAALASKVSDDIKSYDMVWLEHLVGDIHQPLHAIQRYQRCIPRETPEAIWCASVWCRVSCRTTFIPIGTTSSVCRAISRASET